MKKIILLLFLSNATFCQESDEEITFEEDNEALVEEASDEVGTLLPPVSIHISITNINDARSNNKTVVWQENKITHEAEEKKQDDNSQFRVLIKGTAVAALIIGSCKQILKLWKGL